MIVIEIDVEDRLTVLAVETALDDLPLSISFVTGGIRIPAGRQVSRSTHCE
jgi:hypothetical protein